MTVILDSSAYLAYAQGEPGADTVQAAMVDEGTVMSVVNLAEVLTKYAQYRPDPHPIPGGLPGLVDIEEFTADDAVTVAELWHLCRGKAQSLGDRACLALGRRLGLPVLTTDRAWVDLDPAQLGVEVRVIR